MVRAAALSFANQKTVATAVGLARPAFFVPLRASAVKGFAFS
jgi:hypothetical protein